jgi:hypothetical protein
MSPRGRTLIERELERVKGIEPSYSAWKAAALPLSYTRSDGTYAKSRPDWQWRIGPRRGALCAHSRIPLQSLAKRLSAGRDRLDRLAFHFSFDSRAWAN